MKIHDFHFYAKGKKTQTSLRMNPYLLKLLDETIRQDETVNSQSELFEKAAFAYLQSKGKL